MFSEYTLDMAMPVVSYINSLSTRTGWEVTYCQLVAVEQLSIR